MFLPITLDEVKHLGWHGLDVILVTGDSYVDSPFWGAALIGKAVEHAGYQVGVITQPDISGVGKIGRHVYYRQSIFAIAYKEVRILSEIKNDCEVRTKKMVDDQRRSDSLP